METEFNSEILGILNPFSDVSQFWFSRWPITHMVDINAHFGDPVNFSYLLEVWAEKVFLGGIFTCWKNIWGQPRLHSLWVTKKVSFTVVEIKVPFWH